MSRLESRLESRLKPPMHMPPLPRSAASNARRISHITSRATPRVRVRPRVAPPDDSDGVANDARPTSRARNRSSFSPASSSASSFSLINSCIGRTQPPVTLMTTHINHAHQPRTSTTRITSTRAPRPGARHMPNHTPKCMRTRSEDHSTRPGERRRGKRRRHLDTSRVRPCVVQIPPAIRDQVGAPICSVFVSISLPRASATPLAQKHCKSIEGSLDGARKRTARVHQKTSMGRTT